MKESEEKFYYDFLLNLVSALEENGYTIVPVEPTEEMVEAYYEGAETARDAYFERQRQINEVRANEGKKPFPHGIAPVEWFPAAYRAMLSEVSKRWRRP